MSKSIIQLLKDNWIPFGGWPEVYGKEIGEEMQEKANEIDIKEFIRYNCGRHWVKTGDVGWTLNPDSAYRLRPDYQPEQEIEECEIQLRSGKLTYFRDNAYHFLDVTLDYPDFIGFKFEDGKISRWPIRYIDTRHTLLTEITIMSSPFPAFVEVLHATHVLFRRQT